MSIYSQTDLDSLDHSFDNISEEIKKIRANLYKPSLEDKFKIHNIILEYIKTNNKKIYGGYAVNKLLLNANCESIYKNYEVADIDFYSVDPNTDIINICNTIHDANYKVSAREAKHPNTYSIFVEYDLYCDV